MTNLGVMTYDLAVTLNWFNGSNTLLPSVQNFKIIKKNWYPLDVPDQNDTLQFIK